MCASDQGHAAEASGFRAFSRGMSGANMAIGRPMPGTLGQMSTQMETAGLPNSFILAVTRSHVHALEERRRGDELVGGRVLKSWDRAGFQARRGNDSANTSRGVPDDRQVLILFLPIEGGTRIIQAAARNAAAAGSPGFPHRVMVAKDAPSQRVIDVLGATGGAGPNITIGGKSLQEVETLRAAGAITDAEYTAKRQQIISNI